MDDLYTQVLLHQALCQVAQDTANRANYQPYTPPERFIGPEPRSSAGWDSAYQQQAETRYRPGISRNEYTQVVERDGDALVDIRSMQLENSMGNKAARTFGTIGSKVSPWAAPRVTSGFMEGYHEDRYGIRKEDQSPEFKAAMRQASGRDFDNVTKSISKSVGGFVRNTVRGWNHENREEGIRLVKQGMGEFAEQVAPHAKLATETFLSEHKEHTLAVAGPVTHAVGVVNMARRGHNDTKSRLSQHRALCAPEKKRQLKKEAPRLVDRILHRKSQKDKS